MAIMRIIIDANKPIEWKTAAESHGAHLIYLSGVTSPPPTDSLIPNGDGVGKTDWVVTGGGLFDTNLADYWHGANYNNPM